MKITPQPGPQYDFLSTEADIAIYGGAAGGGKTYAILIEPLRHFYNSKFTSVIFRRTTKQITNPGGLWDEAGKIYPLLGAEPKISSLEYEFKSKMKVKFAHLEYDKNVYDWQGAQIPLICFDELTHFTEFQFFYMLSRNRSASGRAGYVRANCNPDTRSWVRKFISWWIDPETGFPIKERSGIRRWFVRDGDEIIWKDSKHEFPDALQKDAKSVTFIPAKLEDNKILMENDPSYAANLKALPRVERMRLLDGNWNVEARAGDYFKKSWFEIIDVAPQMVKKVRYWDRAATEPGPGKDPDWTVGLQMGKTENGIYVVTDVVRGQWSPLKVESNVKNTALQDKIGTTIGIEQDPGQAGVAEAQAYARLLAGFEVKLIRASVDKETRAKPASAQSEAGNIKILRAHWNDAFLEELQNFPMGAKDDQVDAFSGAFNLITSDLTGDFTKHHTQAKIKPHVPSLKGETPW